MHVAVLGGGMQGCCAAIALAARGARVTLYDKNETLLSRAATANEGRIHLGFTYVGDPTLGTARGMLRGAFTFGPFLDRHLGLRPGQLDVSEPMGYLVHRDSHCNVEQVSVYFAAVHALFAEYNAAGNGAYFGRELSPPRRWSNAELEAEFDPSIAAAVFDVPEAAVEPISLAPILIATLKDNPCIELMLNRTVLAVETDGDRPAVASRGVDGHQERSHYDQVVNALWDGRLAIDQKLGLAPPQTNWINRFKYGVRLRAPAELGPLPSVAIISGPFGEILTYRSGMAYVSWYPDCMRTFAFGTDIPDLPTLPGEPLRSEILLATVRGLAGIVRKFGDLDPADVSDVLVKGGVIVAPGKTDIPDPGSELHVRYGMGITTHGRYHSIYPGKLTLTPYYAEMCAERLFPA